MPEDTANPSVLFLNEDLDTIPERHAFLGNYRRFCSSIVEQITRRRPFDALPFIMNNVEGTLSEIRSAGIGISRKLSLKTTGVFTANTLLVDSYRKNSDAFLRIDAQFSVVEAALKGYCKYADVQDPVIPIVSFQFSSLMEHDTLRT